MSAPAGHSLSPEWGRKAEPYASFVPRGLYHHLAEAGAIGGEPQAVLLRSVGLCLDIAGFTTITDRLERGRGEAGIEDVIDQLNRCFGAAIAEATNFGGEVASLTGDGLVILWAWRDTVPAREPIAELTAGCLCALAIRDRTQAAKNAEENLFTVKMSIGVGEVFVGHAMGDPSRGQLLVGGPLVAELSATCALAGRGQILLTTEAQRVSAPVCRARERPQGGFALDAVSASDRPTLAGLPEPAHAFQQPGIRPPAMPALIDREQLDWLAELRVATVMFVGFEGLTCTDAASFDLVRQAASRLDHLARAYSGLLEKIQIDEKGPFSLITFGLPPRIGSYHPDQALAAAIAVRRLLNELGISARIGIATGKVLRCPVGSERRREYTVHGTTVHRAVRIMMHAAGRILCDAETSGASTRGYVFKALEPLALKGMATPAAISQLVLEEDHPPRSTATRPLLGRAIELSWLDRRLDDLNAGRPTITALIGPAGVGKSSLLKATIQRAAELGIEVLSGSGTPLTVGAPYQAWRQVMLGLCGLEAHHATDTQRTRILDLLADDPEIFALAPLIDAVVPVGIPENDVTLAMSERARAIARRELLATLIARQAERVPTLLVFDDAHWLDDISMKLLVEIWLEATGASVLVATRPEEDGGTLLSHLAGLDGFEKLSIEGLDATGMTALIAATFGVEWVADDCSHWIRRATRGHPLFTTELAKVLRERRIVECDGDVARFAISPRDLDALSLPSSVEALVTDRLDRLSPVEQLAFKTASAIGIDFSFSLLQAVYPHPGSRSELRPCVNRLIQAGLFVESDDKESDRTEHLSFAHATFRQAGYNHLPRGQRRALHLAIAQVLEPAADADPTRSYALLAFHYRRAVKHEKALRYLDLASELATRDGAFGVAAELSQQALDVYGLPDAGAARGRLLPRDWRARLARCKTYLGDLDGARYLSCEVLADLGYPWPESTGFAAVKCVAAILRQTGRRFRPPAALAPDRLRELEAAAEAATVLMLAYYYHASPIRLMLACLLAADFASESGERVNASAPYGILAVSAGLMRLSGVQGHLLERYQRNAALCGTADDRRLYFLYLGMHHLAFCDWQRVEDAALRRIEAVAEFADPYFGNVELGLDAIVHYYRGHFARARATFEELRRRADRQHSLQHLAWGNYGMAEALLPLGLVDDAIPLLLTGQGLLASQHDNHSQLICDGLLAIAYLRRGDTHRAIEMANKVSTLVDATPPNNFSSLEGYASAVEIWLGLAHAQGGDHREYHRAAARMLRVLAKYALLYRVGRPRLWLYRGYLHWQRGSARRARRCWARALDWAERNRMPYEIARAATALLTHGSPPAAAAERWRTLADAAFRQTEASRRLSPMEREADATAGS
jgi:class 3 adenylate cyclase